MTRTSYTVETERPVDGLATVPGVSGVLVDGQVTRFEADPEAIGEALRRVQSAGVRSLLGQPPTLEELFLRHYGVDQAEPPEPSSDAHAH